MKNSQFSVVVSLTVLDYVVTRSCEGPHMQFSYSGDGQVSQNII